MDCNDSNIVIGLLLLEGANKFQKIWWSLVSDACFIKSTDYLSNDQRLTDHRPLFHKKMDSIITGKTIFKRFGNRKKIILQNTNTVRKMKNYTFVYLISTIMLKIFWDYLMVKQIFLSPQVKWSVIISLVLTPPPAMKISSVLIKISIFRYFTWKLELLSNILWMTVASEPLRLYSSTSTLK